MKNDVKYSDGILCYIHQRLVRILDVHGASGTEDVIDMVKLMAELPAYVPNTDIDNVGSILCHQNGILTIALRTESVNGGNPLLVVIDVRGDFVPTLERPSRKIMILQEPLPVISQHVISDGHYLVCVNIPDNISEWTLNCYDLSKMKADETNAPTSTIALNEFLPKGNKCRFKLFDGLVYVICADQDVEFDSERHDRKQNLYYNCCRFPINCPITEKPEDFFGDSSYKPLPAGLEAVELYRGKGHFFWKQACLDLVKDEQTGHLFIVETPSWGDWPESDTPYRRLVFPDQPKHTVRSWETKISDIVQRYDKEHYVYKPSRYGLIADSMRQYIQPSQSIMDISYEDLEDPEEVSDRQVVSLRQPSKSSSDQKVLHLFAGSVRRGTWHFPPQSAPYELRDFLSKSGRSTMIRAHADERSLIVMVPNVNEKDSGETDCQLILVNFDSGINFPGLKDLALDNVSDMIFKDGTINVTGAQFSEEMSKAQIELLQLIEKANGKDKAPDARKAEADPWFSNKPALYTKIRQGFRFPPKPTTA